MIPRTLLAALALVSSSLVAGCLAGSDSLTTEGDDSQADDLWWFDAEPLGPEPAGSPAIYPFILVTGFGTSTSHLNYYGVADALRADGHVVYEAEMPPYQTADVRATYLAKTVDEALAQGAEKVHVIGHSMGGLDARALVSTLGYGDRVATVTTIGAPHQGSAFADVILGTVDGLGTPEAALDAFARIFGSTYNDLADDADLHDALFDLSEANAPAWNAAHPDDPRVVYMSWGGISTFAGIPNLDADAEDEACDHVWLTDASGERPPTDMLSPLMFGTASLAGHGFENIPNDGLVTVESAHWGNWQGCIPADHADDIGQVRHKGPDWLTGFDHLRFFRNIAFQYASLGY